ncbi:MAG: diguanylate cyclase [Oscillospiraceae bacterium]|nr:diguanylate cyclase [Oscillospiraceae bacterium]
MAMHTIRFKITLLTMMAIIVCVLGVGGSTAISVKREGDINSAEMMRLLCENNSMNIDTYLNSVQQSVNMVSRFALDEIEAVELVRGGAIGLQGTGVDLNGHSRSEEQQAELDAYLSNYYSRVEILFRSVANRTHGVVSFYLRINPEISKTSSGFLYSSIGRSTFKKLLLTDLSAYAPTDTEHVGWYFIPLERGEPTWIEPYENVNLGIKMLSYVVPLYKSGTFIGVVGMDISYDMMVSQISSIQIYDTGFAYLARPDGVVVYHPDLVQGSSLIEAGALSERDVALLNKSEHNDDPLLYDYQGEEWQMLFNTLANGMKLIVTAPVQEINASWTRLIGRIVAVSLLSMVAFLLIAIYTVRRMTEPLLQLTEASERIAEGNYDVRLEYNGRDEVGKLTATFRHLVDHLNVYISDLNSRAYQDSLTSVRNRGAFSIAARKLDDAIAAAKGQGEPPRFGVVMLDCNDLKKINDTYGHEKGDAYLRTSCALVCRMFPHSPVFRMGGDEFAVLLQDGSYDNREALLANFDYAVEEKNKTARERWERVSLAKGMAVYEPGTDKNTDCVLARADEKMYEDKKRMKSAGKTPAEPR